MQNAQQEQQPESGDPQAIGTNGQQPGGMGIPSQTSAGTTPTDLTGAGNGTIGVGGVPAAGESQFAGNASQPEE